MNTRTKTAIVQKYGITEADLDKKVKSAIKAGAKTEKEAIRNVIREISIKTLSDTGTVEGMYTGKIKQGEEIQTFFFRQGTKNLRLRSEGEIKQDFAVGKFYTISPVRVQEITRDKDGTKYTSYMAKNESEIKERDSIPVKYDNIADINEPNKWKNVTLKVNITDVSNVWDKESSGWREPFTQEGRADLALQITDESGQAKLSIKSDGASKLYVDDIAKLVGIAKDELLGMPANDMRKLFRTSLSVGEYIVEGTASLFEGDNGSMKIVSLGRAGFISELEN